MKHSTIVTGFFKEMGSEEDRVLTWTGSTQAPDRDDDIIPTSAWRLDNYRKNPVILWGHDYSKLPIAKANDVRQDMDAGALVFDIQFPTAEQAGDHYGFTDSVYRLAKANFINASSVGFMSHERPEMKDQGEGSHVFIWPDVELLELSLVPVPAHPEALQNAFNKGLLQPAQDIPFLEDLLKTVTREGHHITWATEVDDILKQEAQGLEPIPNEPPQPQADDLTLEIKLDELLLGLNRLTATLKGQSHPTVIKTPWGSLPEETPDPGASLTDMVEKAIKLERHLTKRGRDNG